MLRSFVLLSALTSAMLFANGPAPEGTGTNTNEATVAAAPACERVGYCRARVRCLAGLCILECDHPDNNECSSDTCVASVPAGSGCECDNTITSSCCDVLIDPEFEIPGTNSQWCRFVGSSPQTCAQDDDNTKCKLRSLEVSTDLWHYWAECCQ